MPIARPASVRRFDDGVDAWEMVTVAPPLALAPWVLGYCDYTERTRSFRARRELPSTEYVVIVNLGPTVELVGGDGQVVRVAEGEGFAAGAHLRPAISRSQGEQTGIHLFVTARGLARIAGVPVAELTNRVVPLGDLLGPPASRLGQRLGTAADATARFEILDRLVSDRIARGRDGCREAHWAAARLDRTPGARVSDLAREIGWSRKHLVDRFRREIGVTPRDYLRLKRFERLTRAIGLEPTAPLGALAARLGYYDQAHMNREVRALTGESPGALRAAYLPAGGGVVEGR